MSYDLHRLVLDGCPPSLNRVGGQGNWRRWYQAKKLWQNKLVAELILADLPVWFPAVTASAQLRYPTNRRRDSDNHSALLAKALGDALQAGEWLDDDTPQHYCFEPVCFRHERGAPEQTTVLLIEGVQPSMFEGAWDDTV